jgi:hypothetical protein
VQTVIYDTFTDTDGVLLKDHTPDAGGPWVKLQVSGAFYDLKIDTNRVILDDAYNTMHVNSVDIPDGIVSVDVSYTDAGNDYAGVVFRVQDNSNYYLFEPTGIGYDGLYKVVGGVYTGLITGLANTSDATYKVDFRGSEISVYIDDVLQGTVIDSEYSTGKVGLYTETMYSGAPEEIRFDNFHARAYVQAQDLATDPTSGEESPDMTNTTNPRLLFRYRTDRGHWSDFKSIYIRGSVNESLWNYFNSIGIGREIEIEVVQTDSTEFIPTHMNLTMRELSR